MPTIQDELQKVRKIISSKPLTEQVWLYLRDNPKKTASQLRPIYGSGTHQVLHVLEKRKMATSTLEERFTGAGPNGSGRQRIKVYSVLGREYELLPLPKKPSYKIAKPPFPGYSFPPTHAIPQANLPTVGAATAPPTAPPLVLDKPSYVPVSIQEVLDSWPLDKAYQAWKYLDSKFNSKS